MQVEQTFAGFRQRLTTILGLTIGLGLLLAAFSIRSILGLEARRAVHRLAAQN